MQLADSSLPCMSRCHGEWAESHQVFSCTSTIFADVRRAEYLRQDPMEDNHPMATETAALFTLSDVSDSSLPEKFGDNTGKNTGQTTSNSRTMNGEAQHSIVGSSVRHPCAALFFSQPVSVCFDRDRSKPLVRKRCQHAHDLTLSLEALCLERPLKRPCGDTPVSLGVSHSRYHGSGGTQDDTVPCAGGQNMQAAPPRDSALSRGIAAVGNDVDEVNSHVTQRSGNSLFGSQDEDIDAATVAVNPPCGKGMDSTEEPQSPLATGVTASRKFPDPSVRCLSQQLLPLPHTKLPEWSSQPAGLSGWQKAEANITVMQKCRQRHPYSRAERCTTKLFSQQLPAKLHNQPAIHLSQPARMVSVENGNLFTDGPASQCVHTGPKCLYEHFSSVSPFAAEDTSPQLANLKVSQTAVINGTRQFNHQTSEPPGKFSSQPPPLTKCAERLRKCSSQPVYVFHAGNPDLSDLATGNLITKLRNTVPVDLLQHSFGPDTDQMIGRRSQPVHEAFTESDAPSLHLPRGSLTVLGEASHDLHCTPPVSQIERCSSPSSQDDPGVSPGTTQHLNEIVSAAIEARGRGGETTSEDNLFGPQPGAARCDDADIPPAVGQAQFCADNEERQQLSYPSDDDLFNSQLGCLKEAEACDLEARGNIQASAVNGWARPYPDSSRERSITDQSAVSTALVETHLGDTASSSGSHFQLADEDGSSAASGRSEMADYIDMLVEDVAVAVSDERSHYLHLQPDDSVSLAMAGGVAQIAGVSLQPNLAREFNVAFSRASDYVTPGGNDLPKESGCVTASLPQSQQGKQHQEEVSAAQRPNIENDGVLAQAGECFHRYAGAASGEAEEKEPIEQPAIRNASIEAKENVLFPDDGTSDSTLTEAGNGGGTGQDSLDCTPQTLLPALSHCDRLLLLRSRGVEVLDARGNLAPAHATPTPSQELVLLCPATSPPPSEERTNDPGDSLPPSGGQEGCALRDEAPPIWSSQVGNALETIQSTPLVCAMHARTLMEEAFEKCAQSPVTTISPGVTSPYSSQSQISVADCLNVARFVSTQSLVEMSDNSGPDWQEDGADTHADTVDATSDGDQVVTHSASQDMECLTSTRCDTYDLAADAGPGIAALEDMDTAENPNGGTSFEGNKREIVSPNCSEPVMAPCSGSQAVVTSTGSPHTYADSVVVAPSPSMDNRGGFVGQRAGAIPSADAGCVKIMPFMGDQPAEAYTSAGALPVRATIISTDDKPDEIMLSTDIQRVQAKPSAETRLGEVAPFVKVKLVEATPSTEARPDEVAPCVKVKLVEATPSTEARPAEVAPFVKVKLVEATPSTEARPDEVAPFVKVKLVKATPSAEVRPTAETKHFQATPFVDAKPVGTDRAMDIKSVETTPLVVVSTGEFAPSREVVEFIPSTVAIGGAGSLSNVLSGCSSVSLFSGSENSATPPSQTSKQSSTFDQHPDPGEGAFSQLSGSSPTRTVPSRQTAKYDLQASGSLTSQNVHVFCDISALEEASDTRDGGCTVAFSVGGMPTRDPPAADILSLDADSAIKSHQGVERMTDTSDMDVFDGVEIGNEEAISQEESVLPLSTQPFQLQSLGPARDGDWMATGHPQMLPSPWLIPMQAKGHPLRPAPWAPPLETEASLPTSANTAAFTAGAAEMVETSVDSSVSPLGKLASGGLQTISPINVAMAPERHRSEWSESPVPDNAALTTADTRDGPPVSAQTAPTPTHTPVVFPSPGTFPSPSERLARSAGSEPWLPESVMVSEVATKNSVVRYSGTETGHAVLSRLLLAGRMDTEMSASDARGQRGCSFSGKSGCGDVGEAFGASRNGSGIIAAAFDSRRESNIRCAVTSRIGGDGEGVTTCMAGVVVSTAASPSAVAHPVPESPNSAQCASPYAVSSSGVPPPPSVDTLSRQPYPPTESPPPRTPVYPLSAAPGVLGGGVAEPPPPPPRTPVYPPSVAPLVSGSGVAEPPPPRTLVYQSSASSVVSGGGVAEPPPPRIPMYPPSAGPVVSGGGGAEPLPPRTPVYPPSAVPVVSGGGSADLRQPREAQTPEEDEYRESGDGWMWRPCPPEGAAVPVVVALPVVAAGARRIRVGLSRRAHLPPLHPLHRR